MPTCDKFSKKIHDMCVKHACRIYLTRHGFMTGVDVLHIRPCHDSFSLSLDVVEPDSFFLKDKDSNAPH